MTAAYPRVPEINTERFSIQRPMTDSLTTPLVQADQPSASSSARPPPILAPFIDARGNELVYRTFNDEDEDLPGIMRLCEEELSEPYNVYTFRYFLEEWPHLTFLVFPSRSSAEAIASIICKQEMHNDRANRGYIGMLSVDSKWRRRGIASKLVELAVAVMTERGAHEIVLETEWDNNPSLTLYEHLGFVREKRLHRFYSNGKDAFRLILPLESHPRIQETLDEADRGRWLVSQGSDEAYYGGVPFLELLLNPDSSAGEASLTRDPTSLDAGISRLDLRTPPVPPRRSIPDYIL